MAAIETSAFLHSDDDAEDALSGSFEMASLKPAAKPNGNRKAAPCRLPCCGGCGQEIENDEALCPGCDCHMHFSCGAPVGDDEFSPFRLCASCESSHLSPAPRRERSSLIGKQPATRKPAPRRRANQNGEVVSSLMSKPSPSKSRPKLERKESKPPSRDQIPETIGLQGSDHSLLLVAFLLGSLAIFIAVEAMSGNVSLRGGGAAAAQDDLSPSSNTNPTDFLRDFQDAWWLESKADDYLSKIFVDNDLKRKMTGYRDVNFVSQGVFSNLCGKHRFDNSKIPKVSIVVGPVYAGFPKELVSMTLHSLLARTPTDLISEIIVLVGDIRPHGGSDKELAWKLEEWGQLSELIQVKHTESYSGPVGARAEAIEKYVTGEIVVVMDAYVEVWSSTWLQHLVLPIMEYSRTVAVPLVHQMTETRALKDQNDLDAYYGMLGRKFQIRKMKTRFDGENKETPSNWQPYQSPFFDGAVFAVKRSEYLKLGGVDRGLERFGGDTAELAMKYWMCRGRVIMVPCSRVGHIPLSNFDLPPIKDSLKSLMGLNKKGDFMYFDEKADGNTIISARNFLRVMQVWANDHAALKLFYKAAFGTTTLPKEWKQYIDEMEDDDNDFDHEVASRDKNKCHDFEWFDKHVLMSILNVHHPWNVKDGNPN